MTGKSEQSTIGNEPYVTKASLRKTTFAGDVTKLVSGTAMAQAFGIIASPVLTRIYGPEAFGVFAIFTSIITVFGVIACLRYELSIMLPETDEEAANLLGVSMLSCVLISLLTVLAIYWGKVVLLRWLNAPGLGPYLWFVPIGVFLMGTFQALNYWNSRTKHYARLSFARVSQAFTMTATQVGLGVGGFAAGGSLIAGSIAGHFASSTVLGGQIWKDDKRLFCRAIKPSAMRDGLKRHKKFPLFGTWAALMNSVSWQLPAFMLSAFFSPGIAGYYALGFRIIKMPMNLLGSSISQVFFQRAAEAKNEGKLAALVEVSLRKLVLVSFGPVLLLSITGRPIFVFVFGANWEVAGLYAQTMGPWVFVWFLSSPLSTIFSVLGRQDVSLRINAGILIARTLALLVGGLSQSPLLAISLFSLSGVIMYGLLSYIVVVASGVKRMVVFRVIFSEFVWYLPTLFVFALLQYLKIDETLSAAFTCVSTIANFLVRYKAQRYLV